LASLLGSLHNARGVTTYRAKIVGILNVTEDSFSDGGVYLDRDAALARAHRLLADGADVVEVGPASSHPEAKPVAAEEEIRRIAPVVDALLARGATVAVDTSQPETQRYAIGRGVGFLNDVTGFAVPAMYAEIARASCRLVVMHSIRGGVRATREHTEAPVVFRHMLAWFAERIATLSRAGIGRDRLILDPGMGLFLGRTPEPSLHVLQRLRTLRERFGLPLMVSVSRKGFLRDLTGRGVGERGAATLAAEIWAAAQGVDFIRTHDAGALHDALRVLRAIEHEGIRP
jgi:dihydropteroate synthase type 2